jgi:two-component system, OmpR family, alkaline phosphatase synthesis response regulator PhoP
MQGSEGRSIVVIEDEDAIRDVVAYNLERAGFRVATAADGREGLLRVREHRPDLVVLDLMLPELDGLDVCRALRDEPETALLPVIMLTAKGSEDDIVAGLSAGADDYVTKPFSPRELVARIEAMLRRSGQGDGPARDDDELPADRDLAADPDRRRVEAGGVVVDPDRHEVLVDGASVRLTRTELRLLHVLLRRPGRVYTREQLVERVMGDNAWITDRTIDVHVRAIRRKLGERADVIETIRGVGYRGRDTASA